MLPNLLSRWTNWTSLPTAYCLVFGRSWISLSVRMPTIMIFRVAFLSHSKKAVGQYFNVWRMISKSPFKITHQLDSMLLRLHCFRAI